MAYIVQKRDYDQKMNSLFHHSPIKIIVPHHLNQLNNSWDTFIANHIFIAPKPPHAQDMPSSSHPTNHHVEAIPPPSQPTTYIPPCDRSPSASPPSSPFHDPIHSPSRDKGSEQEHI